MTTMMIRWLCRCLLPTHVTANYDNNGTAAHGGMVQTMDVRSFDMNNRALILTVLKVI